MGKRGIKPTKTERDKALRMMRDTPKPDGRKPTFDELGRTFGISRVRAIQIYRKESPRPQTDNHARDREIYELRERTKDVMTCGELASNYGLSECRVWQICRTMKAKG